MRRSSCCLALVAALGCGGAAPAGVIATLPADGSMGANVAWPLRITFSGAMRAEPVVISATPELALQVAAWNDARDAVSFTPTAHLQYLTRYEVWGSGTDLAGHSVPFAFWFVTRPDRDAPAVLATQPGVGAVGVPTDTEIVVTFSEPMQPPATFSIYPEIPCRFSSSADGFRWACSPLQALPALTRFVVAVDSRAKDLAGNELVAYAFAFTTG
jgi:hypothetical protein